MSEATTARLGIVGKKVGMTTIFDDKGATVGVTVIQAKDCVVTQVKTKATDGYTAIQVGFGEKKLRNIPKPLVGHYKKANVQAKQFLREFRCEDTADVSQVKPGQVLSVAMFQKGDHVSVTAKSIGRGFQGVVKRWGFHGTNATHGGHKYFRHGGSNGSNTFPGRTLKNKGMPGHTGDARITTNNLEVVGIDTAENLILVKGSVPGPDNGVVVLRTSFKYPLKDARSWSIA